MSEQEYKHLDGVIEALEDRFLARFGRWIWLNVAVAVTFLLMGAGQWYSAQERVTVLEKWKDQVSETVKRIDRDREDSAVWRGQTTLEIKAMKESIDAINFKLGMRDQAELNRLSNR